MMRIPWKTIMLGLLWLLPKTGGCFFEPPTVPQAWYWVTFTDKAGTAGSLERPAELLSPRALARRARLGIPIDSLDLPVSTRYLRRLRQEGAFILHTSRWLNAATVRLAKARAEEIGRLPFVGSVVRVAPWKSDMMEVKAVGELVAPGDAQPDVAPPNSGLSMLGGDSLHALGLKGQGMRIAVLDGGFDGLYGSACFDSLWLEDRIVATRDFFLQDTVPRGLVRHGAEVLTLLAANGPGLFRGAAPQAEYVLLRTEYDGGEFRLEECNWVAGLEYADSLGVDVVNASLSYRKFEDAVVDYNWKELDGRTALSSRAASIGQSRGMLVVVSAGNRPPWAARHVPAPADSPGTLAVGAINRKGKLAGFSARGPTVDQRVKPDLVAPGKNVLIPDVGQRGLSLRKANGTSYAAPLVAGLATCLWQAFPERTPEEIRNALKQSAHLSGAPDRKLGYGIPDFSRAYDLLKALRQQP